MRVAAPTNGAHRAALASAADRTTLNPGAARSRLIVFDYDGTLADLKVDWVALLVFSG